jgi:hypothetical protein
MNNRGHGISLEFNCSDNKIIGNKIINNVGHGLNLEFESYDNTVYHNSFMNNTMRQAYCDMYSYATWDNEIFKVGNYWCDYNGTGMYDIYQDGIDRWPSIFPFIGHHIAITKVTKEGKTVVGQTLALQIKVALINQGDYEENFNLTIFVDPNVTVEGDEFVIRNETDIELTPDEGRNVIFNWNLTGTSKGNYTISAAASIVPGEIVTANNNYTCGWIEIAMTGDITGPIGYSDGVCDMRDVGLVARYFGEDRDDAPANCNIIYDLVIDMRDIGTVARHFGETDP